MSDYIKKLYYFEVLMYLLILLALLVSILKLDYFSIFVTLLILGTMVLSTILPKKIHFKLPYEIELFTTFFIFSSLFLGELVEFYLKYWWWDILLHTTSTMALAIISFGIIMVLLNNDKIKTAPGMIAIFSALIAIGIGGLWEIFEFSMDQIFGLNMQKSGLVDTMWDLIVATIGATIVSFSGYLYLKFGRSNFFSKIIDKIFKSNTLRNIKSKVKKGVKKNK